MKKLVLSYELAWRTKEDKKFMRSKEWLKEIRPRILERDDHTCQYCGFSGEKNMQINHIDGNPKNHSDDNLEVICQLCHMITHAGLWCVVFKSVDLYEKSKYSQNEIIQITRELREKGKEDNEIIEFLGLEKKVPFKQDLKYLANLYGIISSRKVGRKEDVVLTEEGQKHSLQNRDKW